jgi:hypothetical protein
MAEPPRDPACNALGNPRLRWAGAHAVARGRGIPMPDYPDDDEVDLGISLETVALVVDHVRALQGKEETEPEQASEDEDSEAALLQDTPDDMTEAALRAFLAELNEDEQASLIALAWTGRGDYGPEDWEEARGLAADRNDGREIGDYLLGMDNLGDLLAEGVAAFGLSIEEVER